jgi:hypothetical protein
MRRRLRRKRRHQLQSSLGIRISQHAPDLVGGETIARSARWLDRSELATSVENRTSIGKQLRPRFTDVIVIAFLRRSIL